MVISCEKNQEKKGSIKKPQDSTTIKEDKQEQFNAVNLSLENANKLAELPLQCMQQEFPNKLDHVMDSKKDVQNPADLHPAFYGCFDWHSSVHGHWSLVRLLKQFPDLEKADEIKEKLKENISAENIKTEVDYFKQEKNKGAERNYGWAWVLKLAEELYTWDADFAEELTKNLQPLTDLIEEYFIEFLPKMNHAVRVGEHANTAFSLVFAYDYAIEFGRADLKEMVASRAERYYSTDANCPISYEPGGTDFLSPCLEEINIMQRVMETEEFEKWLKRFMPQLFDEEFAINVGQVSERSDGKLVHLDGLNFSRAAVFYDLANEFDDLKHLKNIANQHIQASFENTVNDESYMGSHWLGSFALYALERE